MRGSTNPIRPLVPLVILSGCLLFLAINGLIGGYLMLRDPNGIPMGMPVSYLERTPFQNFLLPGIWLIFIWGCGSLVILVGLWMRPKWAVLELLTFWTHEHWAWVLSVILGIALLVWLTVQVFTLPAMAPIQYILYGLALLLVGLPLLPNMRQYYHIADKHLA
jgi:hypothetical protein